MGGNQRQYNTQIRPNKAVIWWLCIDHVENKNPASNGGWTPLHSAASFGHLDICKLIIDNVDNKLPVNDDGKTIFLNTNPSKKRKYPLVRKILRSATIFKNKFKVNNNVLIPRPDSETLVEQVLSEISINSKKKILDIGTGSGCIIISILNDRKKCRGVGIDISKSALEEAQKRINIANLFKEVSNDYDKMNDIMSLGAHRIWKKDLVDRIRKDQLSNDNKDI